MFRIWLRLLLVMSIGTLVLIGTVVAASQGLEFTGLGHKVLSGPDSDGDLEISVKINVRNPTNADQDAKVVVRAVDKEGYEVFDVELTGKVKAGETRILTDTQYIKEKVYNTIIKWEIEG